MASYCGAPDLLARSYAIPRRFPFPADIRLVMEATAGRCDLYRNTTFCRAFEADEHFEPEYHVREALASFVDGCYQRHCAAIDLGANAGWFAALMLSLGAHVLAVEPQYYAIKPNPRPHRAFGLSALVSPPAEVGARSPQRQDRFRCGDRRDDRAQLRLERSRHSAQRLRRASELAKYCCWDSKRGC